jgi:6-phosphogluconolactonase
MLRAMETPEIVVLPDPAAVARAAADRFVAAAAEAIALTGSFAVSLAGGSTPKAMYELLAAEPYRSQVDWVRTEIYFGDERAVPPDHAESNYRMARQALLDHVPIPADNVNRIRGEIDPEEAAKEYGQRLKARFGADGGVDLCLLGMGDDGHTASLFPGTPAVREREHRVVAQHVAKSTTGDSWRITTTAPFLNRSQRIVFTVTGKGKAARLTEVLEGDRDPERLPSQLIDPEKAKVTWLIDAAAAGMDET